MKKNTNIKRWLGIALVIQLMLVAVVFNLNKSTQQSENRSLVVNVETVDRVVISDGKKQSELAQRSGQWVLPELQNLPVDNLKWQTQLDKLSGQQLQWPVATSSSSHERFKVSGEDFNKRVDLYRGDEKLNSFYLGDSLSLKESYIRELESSKTFTVNLNAADFLVNDLDWLDRKLLKMESVTAIETPKFKIEKRDDQWLLVSQVPIDANGEESSSEVDEVDEPLDELTDDDSIERMVVQSKAIGIANSLGSLAVLGVVNDLELNWDDAITLNVNTVDKNASYLFVENNDKYYVRRNDVKRSDEPLGFEISRSTYEKLTKHSLDDILEEKPFNIDEAES